MVEVSYIIFGICLFVGIISGLIRIWRGPTVGDRLNAADVVALCCVGLAIGHGWYREDGIWLDVAMVAGLVLFVGTSAVSVFLDPKHLSSNDNE